MTTREKSFDCVEMKNRIQAELQEEWKGLSDDEIRAEIANTLSRSSSPVAELWRQIKSEVGSHSSSKAIAPESL